MHLRTNLTSPVNVNGESNYGWSDYGDTDYGPDNDGVTDYNDTDYGSNNDGVTDYNDTDYGPNNDGVTDYNDTDYGTNNDGVTDYSAPAASQTPAAPQTSAPAAPPEGTLAMIPTQTQDTTGTPAMTINRPPLRFRHEYKHLISPSEDAVSPAGSAGFSPGTAMPGPPALTGYAACILILPMTARCAKNLTARRPTGKVPDQILWRFCRFFPAGEENKEKHFMCQTICEPHRRRGADDPRGEA